MLLLLPSSQNLHPEGICADLEETVEKLFLITCQREDKLETLKQNLLFFYARELFDMLRNFGFLAIQHFSILWIRALQTCIKN